MIDRLIATLGQELGLTAEEIADVLWLALQRQHSAESIPTSIPSPPPSAPSEPTNWKQNLKKRTPPSPSSSPSPLPTPIPPRATTTGVYAKTSSTEGSGFVIPIPDAPSLREPLTLARALRALMQRVPSGRDTVLDEAATAQRIAEEHLWVPLLQPTLEPWLELALVIDASSNSMLLWQPTLQALKRLLEHYGAFRDVRTWSLMTDEQGKVQICAGIGAITHHQRLRSPKELIDPRGRRLVLVVSDCVSSIWRNGSVLPALKIWANSGPMALVQMLPEWLWHRTGLGLVSSAELQGLTPGVANRHLAAREVSFWDMNLEAGTKVPVLTLEPEMAAAWSAMVAGRGSAWVPGIIFEATLFGEASEQPPETDTPLNATQRVQEFRLAASPIARRLAGYLSAAPVITLPVVRLIQETLLPESRQVHVAEVFLGGILKPVSPLEIKADTNSDEVQYDFMTQKVRELLLEGTPVPESVTVLDAVSKYVAKQLGQTLNEFAAILRNPKQVKDSKVAEQVQPFAVVTAQVLKRLGGQYAQLAHQLSELQNLQEPSTGQSEASINAQAPSIREVLSIYFSAIDETHFKVIARSSSGEAVADSRLPFFETPTRWRTTLIKVLEANSFRASDFPQEEEQEWMVQQGWLSSDRQYFHPSVLARIGQALYNSLFPEGSSVQHLLQVAISSAAAKKTQLQIQLQFDAEVTNRSHLPDYPWELAHDGQNFLVHHQIQFSRCIAYLAAAPKLPAVEKLNVLLVSSRASDEENGLLPLSKREQKAVLKGLEKAQEEGHIQVEVLEPASLNQLRAYLTEHQPHVFHFDGHGVFGKRCNKDDCRTIHKDLVAQQCKRCGADLPEPQGYLLFETEEDEADYVSAIELGELLRKTGFRDQLNQQGSVVLAVLSACKFGMALGGESVFNGVAQRLINHRLPAVVAMQYTVRVDGATQFAEQFYRSLGRKNSLSTALSHGQKAMGAEGNQWYRPVLYLNWQDNEGGQLFVQAAPFAKPKTGIPFQAPPLPNPYVDRPEVIQNLKAHLLQSRSPDKSGTPALMINAIHGLGGIGKTVTATALAHDPDIQERFADGILWASLGQAPDLLPLLDSWIKELKDYDYKSTTIDTASMHLRTLLYDKQMLLIIDDVWNPEHVEPFRVGGAGCQILVTTREAKIQGAVRYELDVVTEEQAIDLLTRSLPEPLTTTEQAQALALAKEVGYLPLALQLSAGQIEDGVSWSDLLHDLTDEVARLEALDSPNAAGVDEAQRRKYSLLASFNLSLRQLTAEQLQQFAWLGVLPEDVTITQAMAATLWEVIPRQAGAILRTMTSKALLLLGSKQSEQQSFRMHDLMHDCAQRLLSSSLVPDPPEDLPGLGLSRTAAHAALLERYRRTTTDEQWHRLPDDGYIYAHLTWHFEQARRLDTLHQLLRETTVEGRNGWYEAREKLGQTSGYIADLHRAWSLADQSGEFSSKTLGLKFRYALIAASLHSISNIPIELLRALVRKGVWTAQQGLAYTQQIPDLQLRVRNLTFLLEELPNELRSQVLYESWELVKTISDESSRSEALTTLANKLPPELLPQAFEMAQAIEDEESRARVLVALSDKLPEVLPQTLEATRAIKDEEHRARALVALADKLPEVLPEALTAARAIEDEESRVRVLVALSNKLPPEFLPETLEATRAIRNEYSRACALATLADKLPELLPQALQAAQAIEDEYSRSVAMAALTDKLPELLPQALQAAQAIENGYTRARVLATLANKLPELLPQALQAAQAIEDPHRRAEILADLAENLPIQLLPHALEIIQRIEDSASQQQVFAAFTEYVPQLNTELGLNISATQQKLQSKEIRSSSSTQSEQTANLDISIATELLDSAITANDWSIVIPSLPDSLLSKALEQILLAEDEFIRCQTLTMLIPRLNTDLIPNVFEAACHITDAFNRENVLKTITPRLIELSSTDLFSLFSNALHTLSMFTRPSFLSDIATLVPVILKLGNKDAAIEVIRAVQDVGRWFP